MKFKANDLYRAAMIGNPAKITYVQDDVVHEMTVELAGIDVDYLYFRKSMFDASEYSIQLKKVKTIERVGVSHESVAERVASYIQQKQRIIRAGENGLHMRKRFPTELQELIDHVGALSDCAELLDFLKDNGALSGDIRRKPMDAVCSQLEQVCATLSPTKAAFAKCVVSLAKRDIQGAMKAYLDIMDDTLSSEYISQCAAKLAVANVQLSGYMKNDSAFVFWIDQLLQVDSAQVYNDPALWLNYLTQCVTFQHFKPLCQVLSSIKDEKLVFDTIAFVMALNEQPVQACQALDCLEEAYGANYSVGQLLVQLIDDEHSYCVRYADRVQCLLREKMIGKENVGYIYDYVRLRRFAHIVNGYLVSYFVNASDIDARLLDYMTECLSQGVDYEPDMVYFVPHKGGIATNVER